MQQTTRLHNIRDLKTHLFPVVFETAGSWSQHAIELVQEIGICTTVITEGSRETTFLFQRLRGSAEGKCGLILRHFPARLVGRCSDFTTLYF